MSLEETSINEPGEDVIQRHNVIGHLGHRHGHVQGQQLRLEMDPGHNKSQEDSDEFQRYKMV